jgi:hypothetical protein
VVLSSVVVAGFERRTVESKADSNISAIEGSSDSTTYFSQKKKNRKCYFSRNIIGIISHNSSFIPS